MTSWRKRSLGLDAAHSWRARPGNKILMLDRGAVRVEFPDQWVVEPDEDSIRLLDRPAPDDRCRLALSLQPALVRFLSAVTVRTMVESATAQDERPVHTCSEVEELSRLDLRLAWQELRFVDPGEQREARSRLCMGHRGSVLCLITCDFWDEDTQWCDPVWRTVLDTLVIDEPVPDPLRGPAEH